MAKKHKNKKASKVDTQNSDLRSRKKAAVMGASEKKGGYLLPALIAVLNNLLISILILDSASKVRKHLRGIAHLSMNNR